MGLVLENIEMKTEKEYRLIWLVLLFCYIQIIQVERQWFYRFMSVIKYVKIGKDYVMNYEYFKFLEEGSLIKSEEETEQYFMEHILSLVFSKKDDDSNRCINDRFSAKLYDCSAEEKSMSIYFETEEWMLNPNGNLHGGILGTAIDICMCILGRYMAKRSNVVTAQLSINYLRGIHKDDDFIVHVTADHVGRKTIVLRANVMTESTKKVAATATGILM